MFGKQSPAPSRRLLVLFVATTLVPAIGLAWLGWRLVEQDRALENQRIQERRDHAADVGAAALQRVLAEIEEKLALLGTASKPSGQGVAVVVFGPQGVLDHAGAPLPYYPAVPPAAAIPVLNGLVRAKDRAVRAAALVRLARNYRKAGDSARALAAFRELGDLGDTPVNGLPAGLLARQGAALLLETLGRTHDLKREAAAIQAGLHSGRSLLGRTSYELAGEQTRRWLGDSSHDREERERLALAEAAESAWTEWQATARAETNT
jgi:hypothetical protein